jgi:hypothetical protein
LLLLGGVVACDASSSSGTQAQTKTSAGTATPTLTLEQQAIAKENAATLQTMENWQKDPHTLLNTDQAKASELYNDNTISANGKKIKAPEGQLAGVRMKDRSYLRADQTDASHLISLIEAGLAVEVSDQPLDLGVYTSADGTTYVGFGYLIGGQGIGVWEKIGDPLGESYGVDRRSSFYSPGPTNFSGTEAEFTRAHAAEFLGTVSDNDLSSLQALYDQLNNSKPLSPAAQASKKRGLATLEAVMKSLKERRALEEYELTGDASKLAEMAANTISPGEAVTSPTADAPTAGLIFSRVGQ